MVMNFYNEHQRLLMRREGRVVMGQRAIGMWLLILVFTATFLSVAFSAGSLDYLDERMNDPYTFWLNVDRKQPSVNLGHIANNLQESGLPQHFLFDDVETNLTTSLDIIGKNGSVGLFSTVIYENLRTDLIAKVLSDENVIKRNGQAISIAHDSISDRSLGVVMTKEALSDLGFDTDSIPSFVCLRASAPHADTLGFKLIEEKYVEAPVPLLAVVRRLPMNKAILTSKYMNSIYEYEEPFNLSKEKYVRTLYFFVPDEVNNFEDGVMRCIQDSSLRQGASVSPTEIRIAERLRTWRPGRIMTVYFGKPATSNIVFKEVESYILEHFKGMGVERVYNYGTDRDEYNAKEREKDKNIDNILSIHFSELDSIRAFEEYMKKKFGIQIEMSQVNSKENFSAVSNMANVLTMALILFSIISIIIFVVNMMQSYFQKVKRNLGTFKAFGISTNELIKVYITIIIGIVLLALGIALAFVWLIELLLPLFGCLKDGEFSYLILWNMKTLWALVIILISTGVTVFWVMRHQLRRTPGDLVYDR